MTKTARKNLVRLAWCGAFVVVIAAAGCAGTRSGAASARTSADAAVEQPDGANAVVPGGKYLPDTLIEGNSARAMQPAPKVNMFGELNGEQRGPVRPVSESGFQQHTFAEEGYDADVSVDPSGRYIAFASTRHHEHPDVYLQRVDGISVTQLTADPADDVQPTFSPDGKQLAFCSNRSGSWDIYVMDVDGRNVVQVTSGPMQDMHPSFSPDGKRLVYCSLGSRSDQWELWTVDLLTQEKKMIGYGLFPSWSPDKTRDRIAFQKNRQRGSRWFSLWTLELVDGEARRLTEVAVSSNAAIITPTWSPDGKRLAFTTVVEPSRENGRKPDGQQDIWVVDADGSNRHRLTDGNGANLTPCWGANNRIYFVSDRSGNDCVWSVFAEPGGMFTASGDSKEHHKAALGATDAGAIAP